MVFVRIGNLKKKGVRVRMAELKMDMFIENVEQKVVEHIKKNYIKRDVLDKIRNEIIELWGNDPCAYEHNCLDEMLNIIDKYKAESEDKDDCN